MPDVPASPDRAPDDVAPAAHDPVPGADPAAVGAWLADAVGDPAWRHCTLRPIGAGRSNLTYRVDSPAGAVVLRRPPIGEVAATAHDMGRERRVISALAGTAVPVPRVLAGSTGGPPVDAPCFVMELVDGVVPLGELPPGWAESEAERLRASRALVDVLVALHAVDPGSVGLGDFGQPGGVSRPPGAALGESVGAGARPRPRRTRRRRRTSPASPRRSRTRSRSHSGTRSCTATTGSTTACSTRPTLDGSGRCSTGSCRRSATRWPTSACCSSTGTRPTSGPSLAGRAAPVQPHRRCPASSPAPRSPGPTHAGSGLDLAQLHWYVAFGAFKLAVVLAGILARVHAGMVPVSMAGGTGGQRRPARRAGPPRARGGTRVMTISDGSGPTSDAGAVRSSPWWRCSRSPRRSPGRPCW